MKILFVEHFKRQLKKLVKKYPHAKNDLLAAFQDFSFEGSVSLRRSIYKIRVKSSDISKGKSGAFRVYVYFFRYQDALVPLSIYSKSDKESLSVHELQYHIDKVFLALQSYQSTS